MDDLDIKISSSYTKDIKNTYNKFIQEFAKLLSSNEDSATELIIEHIIKRNIEDTNYKRFKDRLLEKLKKKSLKPHSTNRR